MARNENSINSCTVKGGANCQLWWHIRPRKGLSYMVAFMDIPEREEQEWQSLDSCMNVLRWDSLLNKVVVKGWAGYLRNLDIEPVEIRQRVPSLYMSCLEEAGKLEKFLSPIRMYS